MNINVKVKDNSEETMAQIDEALENAFISIGEAAETYAKLLCPVGTPESTGIPGYIGGTLRGSITYATHTQHSSGQEPAGPDDYAERAVPDEKSVVIGTNVYYASYVEQGTSRMRKRPYLEPAMANHLQEYQSIFESYLNAISD